MKSQFPGHFSLTSKELKALWKDSLIVFDANILLGLYRYSDQTRTQFLETLSKAKERCWLPHRSVSEFFSNRLNVISQQETAYENTIKSLDELELKLKNTSHPPFIASNSMEKLFGILEETKKELNANKENHSSRVTKDDILMQLEGLFEGRIGSPLSDSDTTKICKEGEERYKRKVPPGYKDAAKADEVDLTRPYGDLLLWKQILDKASADKISVIFVCDDRKEDWWLQHKGKTLGPRPELIAEFRSGTGMLFHMYTSDHFLEYAGKHFDSPVSTGTVAEMREQRKLVVSLSSSLAAARKKELMHRRIRAQRAETQEILREIEVQTDRVASVMRDIRFRTSTEMTQDELSEKRTLEGVLLQLQVQRDRTKARLRELEASEANIQADFDA